VTRRPAILAGVFLLAAACGGPPPTPPQQPVVLWQSAPPEPEFPVPPDARWAPLYQRLRCKLEERNGTPYRWTCFAGGKLETVLELYAGRFGIEASSRRIERRRAAEVFRTVRDVAAELGHTVPSGPTASGTVRIARFGAAGRLPMVQLESPYLDLETGKIRNGTLISMRWRPPEETP